MRKSVSTSPCAGWLVAGEVSPGVYLCVVHVVTHAVLPVQCKGVVELHMRMSHGVKGWELLQSLHQLHDGLIILDDKRGTH